MGMEPCGLCGEFGDTCPCWDGEDDFVIFRPVTKLCFYDIIDRNPGWWPPIIQQGGGNTI